MGVGLLYSNSLVEAQGALTQAAAAGANDILYQAVAPEAGNPGIDSYLRQLGRRLGKLALPYEEIRGVSPEEAIARMRAAHGKRGVTIVMTPNKHLEQLLPVLAEDPARDGDAMTPEGRALRWAATPRSIHDLAESRVGSLRNFDPDRMALIGVKGDVMSRLLEWLRAEGIEPGKLIDRSNSAQEVPELHRNADLIIAATGVAGLLTTTDLLRTPADGKNPVPMTVIDAGVGLNKRTGITHGDVDPILYVYRGEQDLAISPAPVIFADGFVYNSGGGVGPLTVEGLIAAGVMEVPGPLDVPARVA